MTRDPARVRDYLGHIAEASPNIERFRPICLQGSRRSTSF
ncbi:MAG: hypothetical protein RL375_2321 [Pseudomonadota bacterium]